MATVGSAKATLVNKIDSLTSSATAKDTIFLAKALKENSSLNNFVWQGPWTNSTAYYVDDVVTNSGNTYMCILAYTSGSSFAVGSNWSLMAEKGTDGTTVGTGTAGQVLKTDSAGTGIEWGADEGGKILQFISATKSDRQTTTTQGWVDVTGLSVVITPSSTTSKIMVQVDVQGSASSRYSAIQLVRGTTAIGIGDASGSRGRVSSSMGANESSSNDTYVLHHTAFSFLDDPTSTSALTYKIQFGNTDGAHLTTINRPNTDADAIWNHSGISTITVMEIGA